MPKTRCDRCGKYPISEQLLTLDSGEEVCEWCIGRQVETAATAFQQRVSGIFGQDAPEHSP